MNEKDSNGMASALTATSIYLTQASVTSADTPSHNQSQTSHQHSLQGWKKLKEDSPSEHGDNRQYEILP